MDVVDAAARDRWVPGPEVPGTYRSLSVRAGLAGTRIAAASQVGPPDAGSPHPATGSARSSPCPGLTTASRQAQPGVRGNPALVVAVHDRAAAAADQDRVAGQSDRGFVSAARLREPACPVCGYPGPDYRARAHTRYLAPDRIPPGQTAACRRPAGSASRGWDPIRRRGHGCVHPGAAPGSPRRHGQGRARPRGAARPGRQHDRPHPTSDGSPPRGPGRCPPSNGESGCSPSLLPGGGLARAGDLVRA